MSRSAKPHYLTKSRYNMAIECRTNLFYTGKSDEYAPSYFRSHAVNLRSAHLQSAITLMV